MNYPHYMRMSLRHLSPAAAGTALVLATLVAAPTAAHAAAPRAIVLSPTGSDSPSPSANLGQMQIDASMGRGYVIDLPSEDLLVYDVSGAAPRYLTRIGLGSDPVEAAVDEGTHQVYVSDRVDNTVLQIDGHPASPTANTIVDTISTTGIGGAGLAVDAGSKLLYVANTISSDLSVIDLSTHGVARIPLPGAPSDVVTLAGSNKAWVTSEAASTLTLIDARSPRSSVVLGGTPLSLGIGAGGISIGTRAGAGPFDYRVEMYDTLLALTHTSAALDSKATSFATDATIYSLFVTTEMGQLHSLRLDTLVEQGDPMTMPKASSVAVDDSTRRVITTTSALTGGTVTSYDVTASPLIVSPASYGAGVGMSFTAAVIAVGRPTAMTFSLASGTLPPGVALDPTGILNGVPTTAGTFRFTVAASNGLAPAAESTLEIVVAPSGPTAPTITTATVPNGTVGTVYPDTTLVASGSPEPALSVSSGTLPPGLEFDERRAHLYGTPTKAGSYDFTLKAENASGVDTHSYTIVIAADPASVPHITSAPPADGRVGDRYPTVTVTATGTPAPEFSVSSGTLPPGLSFDERTHQLAGTPTKAGSYAFTITADNGIAKDSKEYRMTIAAAVTPTPVPTPTATPSPTPTSVPKAGDGPGPGAAGASRVSGPGAPGSGLLASTGVASAEVTLLGVAAAGLVGLGAAAAALASWRRRAS
ncbi:hypothetical protein GCM10017602_09640 [Herbiconiux flava]|nr:hypothetical protein GCM10017602_09640 [Herbiconiux flava]